MRIMELVSGRSVNGAVVTCLEMTRALAERGHELTVLCRPESWVQEHLHDDKVDLQTSTMKRWPIDELRRVAALVRSKRIDILHTHMSSANFFGVILRRMTGVPVVATANNRYFQLHWMWNDHVLAASEATMNFHRRYNLVAKKRIEVVYNYIDESPYRAITAETREQARRDLGIPAGAVVAGCVGDVIPRKGLLYLVRSLPALIRRVPELRVVSVGGHREKYVAQLKQEAEDLGVADRIVWAGCRNDIARMLAAFDLFVLPTLEDNLPLAILEAMACGLPVVASSVGGIPECVVDHVTGRLVPPGDVFWLTEALTPLLQDPELRARMGEAGRQRLRQEFSRESQTDRVERAFERLVARQPSRRAA